MGLEREIRHVPGRGTLGTISESIPFAAYSFLFRVTFDVVHRFMAVPAFGTKTNIQRPP